jgi:hypothetical protein
MINATKVCSMKASGRRASAISGLPARRWFALGFALAISALAGSTAWAQIGGGPVGTGRAGMPKNTPEKPPEPLPDAIPGYKARGPAAPATRQSGDMQPTDALFDAINRGDIAAARDALNRGADLNGVNILGMTPMELSVDLGRNDISFLLLSMRGEDSGRGSRAVGRDTPPVQPVISTAKAGKPAGHAQSDGGKVATGKGAGAKVAGGKASGRKVARAEDTPVVKKPVATPKLFANDGGAPLPSAGFLGFNSRTSAN